MEVRVYYDDGCIEAHRIPDYVGDSSTTVHEGIGSETHNFIDNVCHVTERFWHTDEGYWLGYSADGPASLQANAKGDVRASKGPRRDPVLVVSEDMMSFVTMILVDGEQVYPKANGIGTDFRMSF